MKSESKHGHEKSVHAPRTPHTHEKHSHDATSHAKHAVPHSNGHAHSQPKHAPAKHHEPKAHEPKHEAKHHEPKHDAKHAEPKHAAKHVHEKQGSEKHVETKGITLKFSELGLCEPVLRALVEEKYETPTPIQAQAIPPAMLGKDLLGCAQTGTGKTAAFALPILHRLMSMPIDKARRGPLLPRVLILSPTRELATQISDSFAAYGRHTGLTGTTIYGGVSQFHQVKALQRGIDILVATPGRLMDLMQQRHVNLSAVCIFVLDEADRMLDMGFINPIRKISAALPPARTVNRQTLLFSATMPKEIMHLADSLLHEPVKIAVTPVASAAPMIKQSLYFVPRMSKQAMLEHLLKDEAVDRALVFTKTKHGADRVAKRLKQANISSDAIHGNKAQNARTRALDGFRSGRTRVLVATDVAARGLDVDNISHVINFDLPMEPEAYVHRIGRTGRAGATGIAISFCDHEERGLLRDIERMTGKKVPVIAELPELPVIPHTPSDRRSDGYQGGRPTHAPAKHSGHAGHRGSGHGGSHGGASAQSRPPRLLSSRGSRGSGR